MSAATTTLVYAVRFRVIAKYLGQLGVMLAIMALVPCIVALWMGENVAATRYLMVIVVLVVGSVPALRLPAPRHIQVNEALLITALAFLVTPLLMSFPLMASGLSAGDALFEAISAVTTTGLTTVVNPEQRSDAFLFSRAWMQWYGGLGIVVLSVALLMGHRAAARRLVDPLNPETLASTTRAFARRMLAVYLLLTAAGLVLVWVVSGNGFQAVTHVLAAVSTGGFSTYADSLGDFDSWSIRYVIIGLAVLGALPLTLYYRGWRHGWAEFARDPELRTLLLSVSIVSAMLWLLMGGAASGSTGETLNHAVLLGLSAHTTAGFSSMDVAGLDDSAKLVLIAGMTIGGGVGSTAGGIKLLRLLIVIRMVQLLIQRTAVPSHAFVEPRLAGKRIEPDDLQRSTLLILLFAAVVFVSWLVFVAFGYAPIDALFEVVSATGTVGLSTGITGPDLNPLLKAVLCVDMLAGRLEIMILFYPRTWFGKRTEAL